MSDGRTIQRALEAKTITPEDAVAALARAAHGAATSALRIEACRALGALSGRAHHASWEVAERAAFVLLEIARDADAPAERAQLLRAMGRGFRNLWLLPYVHARLGDDDEEVVAAAISAAGGLAFPALEKTITGFLDTEDEVERSRAIRLAAIAALGRMGAESAAPLLAARIAGGPSEAAAALSALTEIRSRAGVEAAIALLAREPGPDVLGRAVRYLAELGREEVLAPLERLSRDDDPELRIAASLASRAYHGERSRDAGERILAALTETDRAVRSSLARRLRTLPVAEVLEQAELLSSDDPEGVVQIVAEVRAPEVTRFLLALAAGDRVGPSVRARAAGSIEANEAWERSELVALVRSSRDAPVRVAAIQTLGAFAETALVLDELAPLIDDPAPAVRGALLWALQLSTRPQHLEGSDRGRCEAIVARAIGDEDAAVRRRAAYVAGNLDASSLVPRLIDLARAETERVDLRVAAFVGLAEIGASARIADLVHLVNREDDPAALGAASQALERAVARAPADVRSVLERSKDRLPKLLAADDARSRAAGARIAGLALELATLAAIAERLDDPSPRVREQAVGALGRLGSSERGAEAEPALAHALGDADLVIQERAALALLARASAPAAIKVLAWISRAIDPSAALRVARKLKLPDGDRPAFAAALDAALERIGPDHPAYEELLDLKVRALDAARPSSAPASGAGVDAAIAELFPTWTKLSVVRGFAPLAKSLRTAEMLYGASASADADQSAAIVLWAKSMEGYLHAWLAPRLGALQREPHALWELVDGVVGSSWPQYQRWLGQRWSDPVKVGSISVEVPLRSAINALRELGERRSKHLDSPMSVTEWSRMMLFLALDHPSGPKNVLGISSKDADRVARLSHRLQVVAQVRNTVAHRSVADAATLGAFRKLYYASFEELTGLA